VERKTLLISQVTGQFDDQVTVKRGYLLSWNIRAWTLSKSTCPANHLQCMVK